MDEHIEAYLHALVHKEGLPPDTLERAQQFLRYGDLNQLIDLPFSPDVLHQIGELLIRARSTRSPSTAVPMLPPATHQRLRDLVGEDGAHAEAALFVLSQNLRACALNRSLGSTHLPDSPTAC